MSMNILVINGPSLNLLGMREPQYYGIQTYADLCDVIRKRCKELKVGYKIFQSNHEGEIVDEILNAFGDADGIVINAGSYSHTSVAILDALRTVRLPYVEVHLSDIYHREPFRAHSYLSEGALGVIVGHGFQGYVEAIDMLKINDEKEIYETEAEEDKVWLTPPEQRPVPKA